MKLFSQIMKNEEGATAIEYGLIAALIAVALIVAMGSLGGELGNTFSDIDNELEQTNNVRGQFAGPRDAS